MFSFPCSKIVLAVFACLAVAFAARGDKTLTLGEAVAEALAENPALKASQSEVDAQKARIAIAKSLDDPEAGVEFYDVPIDTADVTKSFEINYSLIQKFPFPGKRSSLGKSAENNYLAQKSFYEGDRLALQVQTEHAFHDLYFVERSLRINRELVGLWRKLAGSEQALYTTGKESAQNFLRAKLELERLQTETALLEAQKIGAQARLNILRHRDPGEPIHLAEIERHEHPFPSYEEFERSVLKKHPELKGVEYQMASSKDQLSFAKKQAVLPDLKLRGTYAQHFNSIDNWTAEAMINIPFLWGKSRKELKTARAMAVASEHKLAGVKDEKLASLKEAYARWESARQSHRLFQGKILPNALMALKSAQSAYETGEEDFLNYVDTARQFQSAKLGALKSLVEYQQAITDLKMSVGEDFMPKIMGGKS